MRNMRWRGDAFKYRKCSNCERTEFECFIHINRLCVLCQLMKDRRLAKRKGRINKMKEKK